MDFAKLIDGDIFFAPNPIIIGDRQIGNPPGDVYTEQGYKPVVYTDPPVVAEGYMAVPGWEEQDEAIVQIWTVVEEPDEVGSDRAMEILFEEEGE